MTNEKKPLFPGIELTKEEFFSLHEQMYDFPDNLTVGFRWKQKLGDGITYVGEYIYIPASDDPDGLIRVKWRYPVIKD